MNDATSISRFLSFRSGRPLLLACIGLIVACTTRPAWGQEVKRVGTLDVGDAAKRNSPMCVVFTADSKQIAVGDQQSNVHVFSTSGKRLGFIEISDNAICETALSPDGRTLAVTDRQKKLTGGRESCVLKLVDLKTRTMLRAYDLSELGPCRVVYRPDGRSLAVGTRDRDVTFFDPKTLKTTKTTQAKR